MYQKSGASLLPTASLSGHALGYFLGVPRKQQMNPPSWWMDGISPPLEVCHSPHVGIINPLVLKTNTWGRKSWQGNFSWSRGCKHVLTPGKQAQKHKMADSGSSLHPWCSCTCPTPGICPDQRFTVFPDRLKALGDGLGHAVWQTMELYRNLEEARTL
jgi:hypothetical protein